MKLRIEFGFGGDLDKGGYSIHLVAYANAMSEIKKKALELFDGYTIYDTKGGWKNAEGKLFEEGGHTLLVYTDNNLHDAHIKSAAMAEFIKEQLNQEAVYVSQFEVNLTQV